MVYLMDKELLAYVHQLAVDDPGIELVEEDFVAAEKNL